ncbi:hypothetical protein AR457_41955 (plasmid) [Streptomyces agglomeratus]|nr:hypothetical protein AR457_41955 [Streptomyces agglomeratus]
MPEERAGEAVVESAAEAVQTAVMAARLVMAVADAARRHQQRRQKGKEEDLPSGEEAVGEVSETVKRLLPSDISAALMQEADWPLLAQQLMALRQAGVDLDQVLPRVGEIAVNVRDQVAAKAQGADSDQWVRVVRETLPAGPVREAILASPAWPEMAATMARLEEKGVNVREVLAAAHNEVLAVEQVVAIGLGGTAEPAMSRDAQLSYGPLTTGLDLPRDLDLSDRERVLKHQLAISPQENEKYIRWVREAMPGHEREADLLVASRQWPLVAGRMAQMEKERKPVREHLARLAKDTSWQEGSGTLGSRLAQAAGDALHRPAGDAPAESRVKVNTAAARATSLGPTKAVKAAAPTEVGVAAHRQLAPAPTRTKSK